MRYEATGQILVIHDTQTFTSGFQKREFVLKVPDGKYPQEVKFEVLKDNCDLLDRVKPGDEIKVHFGIRGNEFKGRHYVNLVCFSMEFAKSMSPSQEQPPSARPEPQDDSSEIPF